MAILKTTKKATGEVLHEEGGYDYEVLTNWVKRTLAELGDVYLHYEVIKEEGE